MNAIEKAYEEAAQYIGCDLPAIRAVFDVEASDQFLDSRGEVISRFEPHKFPREHWSALGFYPGKTTPWRASLKIDEKLRREMYEEALIINAEAANLASSHGAPQIMGFNCRDAGYRNASSMKEAFEDPVKQIMAFASLVVAQNHDSALRAHDWLSFARYNGSGQPTVYAAKVEKAYRRRSGQKSAVILRRGSSGQSVISLQKRLVAAGHMLESQVDGQFGPATESSVKKLQEENGLAMDGVVGAMTWKVLPEVKDAPPVAVQKSETENQVEKVAEVTTRGVGVGIGTKALDIATDVDEAQKWADTLGFDAGLVVAVAAVIAIVVFFGPEIKNYFRRET